MTNERGGDTRASEPVLESRDSDSSLIFSLRAELREQAQELERLREALDEYGRHTVDCRIDAWLHIGVMSGGPEPDCTCGFEAALTSVIPDDDGPQKKD